MKETIKALCCACCAVLCVTACSEIEDNVTSQNNSRQVSITGEADTFTALAATRTQVGDIADDGALTIEWSVGDTLGVFSEDGQPSVFTSTNTEPATSTTFTGTLTGGGEPRYAFYPYDAEVTDLTKIPVTIPAEQMYRDETSVAQYDFKASNSITANANGGYRMAMRQMAALVRFEVNLSGVPDLADDELLLAVTIRPTEGGDPMTGDFTYSLANLDAGLSSSGETNDGLTIKFAVPPTARETITAYAVVAPGKHEREDWTCYFVTDRKEGTFKTTALCDFEAGKYYTVPLTAEVLKTHAAAIEPIPEEELEETANCYIVTKAGEYSLKATVIGNGPKGIIPGAGFHTENPYINPKSAKVLWSDKKGFVTDVRLENGRVYYTVPESVAFTDGTISGNAVIAVYSEPDCQGDILWSWHIWGTIGMPEDEEYTNQAGAKFLVMDRELGAVRVGQNGTLYQWGRKDPFPGVHSGSSIYNEEDTKTNVANSYPNDYKLKLDNATIENAVRNPQSLISKSVTGQLHWLGEPNCYLWGDAEQTMPATLDDPAAGEDWKQQKTIYDPSPVGYRVANVFTFSGFTKMTSGNTSDVEDTDDGFDVLLERLDYINYVKAKVGTNDWWFIRYPGDTEGVLYSAIRSRDGSTGMKKTGAGEGGYWWTAEAFVAEDGKQHAYYLNTDEFADAANGVGTANIISTYVHNTYLRDAYAVRCVREK